LELHGGALTLCWANGYADDGSDPYASLRRDLAQLTSTELGQQTMFWIPIRYGTCTELRDADVRVALTSSTSAPVIAPPPPSCTPTLSLDVHASPGTALLTQLATLLGAGDAPLVRGYTTLSALARARLYQRFTAPRARPVVARGAKRGDVARLGVGVFGSDVASALLPFPLDALVVPPGDRVALCGPDDAGCSAFTASQEHMDGAGVDSLEIDPVVELVCTTEGSPTVRTPLTIGRHPAGELSALCAGEARVSVHAGREAVACTLAGECRSIVEGMFPLEGLATVGVREVVLLRRDRFWEGAEVPLAPGDYFGGAAWSALGSEGIRSVTVPPGLALTACRTSTPTAFDWANGVGECVHVDGSFGGSPALDAALGGAVAAARVDVGSYRPVAVAPGCETATYLASPVAGGACEGALLGSDGVWTAAPLFPGSSMACAYTWSSTTSAIPNLRALAGATSGGLVPQCGTPSGAPDVTLNAIFQGGTGIPNSPPCDVCGVRTLDLAFGAISGGTVYLALDAKAASATSVGVIVPGGSPLLVHPKGNQVIVIPNASPGAPDGVISLGDLVVSTH
jgi:hypothetical protein